MRMEFGDYTTRDPNRIDYILEELKKYWEKYPDLRLGQIISNATNAYDKRYNDDPFYIEDDKLIEGLRKLDD